MVTMTLFQNRDLEPTSVRQDDCAETHKCKRNGGCELRLEATRECKNTNRNVVSGIHSIKRGQDEQKLFVIAPREQHA